MSDTPFQPLAFAQNLVVRGLIGLGLALPYRWRVPLLGAILRGPVGRIAGYRQRAEANLALIWPDMPLANRKKIATQSLDNAGRTLIENYSTKDFQARQAQIIPQGAGVAALAKAQAEGRAAILVSGHFGNYEAARACLVAQGYTIGGLYRPMSNRYFNAHYVQTMEAFGGPVFPQGRAGTTGFVKHLKAGGLLVLLFDQRAGSNQICFLGQPARTALSAAELALRYKADLIPFYATRQPDGLGFAVELEAPIPHSSALEMTTALTRSLEARIITNPGQWFWIHRRWK
ncbi:lipid A biosynthesis lauroyl acyltransferase [Cypionkella aquatica]|uniref:Lipid A biosynthesis lauroyl acyltransferase n=1 Tax=Cypionkella aquatica TaxID=1756042 RepID=A0AA37U8P7_9RHOB|nr:lysophospholipid acyltransferase family protein [Cypionkella aquatica]GLS87356.1 lipid A biosynthesis lauroyl acyltransferase [Cypionkella aquatica]